MLHRGVPTTSEGDRSGVLGTDKQARTDTDKAER
jgi:hypothetical protein